MNTRQIESMLGDLSRKAGLVMSRASNRAAITARQSFWDGTKERYRVTKADVIGSIRIKKAFKNHPYATLISSGTHRGLEKFKVSPFRPLKFTKRRKRSPHVYKAAVMKNQGLKPLDGNPKPFVAVLSNGHKGVFVRKDVSRLNKGKYRHRRGKEKYRNFIKSVQGPAIPQILKNKDILETVINNANDTMVKRVEHEIDIILNKTIK